ncbi:major facilitator superfamily domain-containing protein [Pseudomassariella vexata]|uniref:Major facilitator superfamily domain-containing protein n=1 Tax=Pseudomassariella vexata TaxID=1141098 RepID=A0A1Y2DPC6_9PEZI|nr:major facilitator superfamily domain-containing protein [Pseudomassariella vexata]ORY61029.1 major facilitator superfamily domain-containing protein [Pseudomassariella vexata]
MDSKDTEAQRFDTIADEIHVPIDTALERKLMRKIDFMILPYLAVCYAFFYIDKTTLSYAAIFGIRTDLNLSGTEYSWLSGIFYVGYLIWALPTNFLLQRFPMAKYLGINIFAWSVLLMLQAVSTHFATLAALRALSGAAEACADPAFMLITSIKGALPSWKYEFIIIGTLCCIRGIMIFFMLPSSPVTTKHLTADQKELVVERLRENQTGIENKTLKPYQVREAFADYKLCFLFAIALMQSIVNGGGGWFNYSTLATALLQIPYGALIFVAVLGCVYINDRMPPSNRCYMIVIFLLPNIAGAVGMRFLPQDNSIGRLICYYLTGSINASFVLLLSLQTANTAGHTKKVVTSACLFFGYCTGNIAGPFFYKTEQAPRYTLGIWSMIIAHLLEVVIVVVLRFLLKWENDKRDRLQGIGGHVRVEMSEATRAQREADLNVSAFGDLTDWENLNFPIYILNRTQGLR